MKKEKVKVENIYKDQNPKENSIASGTAHVFVMCRGFYIKNIEYFLSQDNQLTIVKPGKNYESVGTEEKSARVSTVSFSKNDDEIWESIKNAIEQSLTTPAKKPVSTEDKTS